MNQAQGSINKKWRKMDKAKIFDISRNKSTDGPQLFRAHTQYYYGQG